MVNAPPLHIYVSNALKESEILYTNSVPKRHIVDIKEISFSKLR